jgi:hypothetical protein
MRRNHNFPLRLRQPKAWTPCNYPNPKGGLQEGAYFDAGDGCIIVHLGAPMVACQQVDLAPKVMLAYMAQWLVDSFQNAVILAWTGAEWNVMRSSTTPAQFILENAYTTARTWEEAIQKGKTLLGGPSGAAGPAGA